MFNSSFISCFKNKTKGRNTFGRFQIRCKSTTKKRSHQKSDFAKYVNYIFFSFTGQIVARILGKMEGLPVG